MGYLFAFERLEVWQLARNFFKQAYTLIDSFPSSERYNLVDQIRRAATSIALNLAEMTSRSSYKEQAHYSEIAYGSTIEVYCAFLLSYDLGYINEQQLEELKEKISELSNKTNALKKQSISTRRTIQQTTFFIKQNQQLNT